MQSLLSHSWTDKPAEQLKRTKSSDTATPSRAKTPEIQQPQQPTPPVTTIPIVETISQNDPLLASTFDPVATFSPFGSEAANLEYSILSAILGNPSPPDSTGSPPPPQHAQYNWPAEPLDFATSYTSSYSDGQQLAMPPDSGLSTSPTNQYLNYAFAQRNEEPVTTATTSQVQSGPLHPLQPRFPLDQRPRSPPAGPLMYEGESSSKGLLTPPLSNASPISTSSVPPGVAEMAAPSHLQSINDRVTKPYNYTEGYHFLMKHLPTRFEKNDILRIVRALSIFRPSLIALQMPLSTDDEIFVEKCFQRSLLVSRTA